MDRQPTMLSPRWFVRRLQQVLATDSASAFAPASSDRAQLVTHALERQFVRIVPLAAAAALLLAGYNWWGARGTATSAIDAALNLPQVTLASAYSISSLFGTTVASEQP